MITSIFGGHDKGMELFADIMPSLYPGEYNLTVTFKGLHGERCIDYSKTYKTMAGAEKALRRKYPDTGWEEM